MGGEGGGAARAAAAGPLRDQDPAGGERWRDRATLRDRDLGEADPPDAQGWRRARSYQCWRWKHRGRRKTFTRRFRERGLERLSHHAADEMRHGVGEKGAAEKIRGIRGEFGDTIRNSRVVLAYSAHKDEWAGGDGITRRSAYGICCAIFRPPAEKQCSRSRIKLILAAS